MQPLLQFSQVACLEIAGLSFTLASGEGRVLEMPDEAVKSAAIDLALGEKAPTEGSILFGGRPLERSQPGRIGWVAAGGGLISNLKTWENVTLPLWYHGHAHRAEVDASIARWLSALGKDSAAWEDFMARPPALLKPLERKLAGLLRGLVQAPLLLVVDADLFAGLDRATLDAWTAALDTFVQEDPTRAVLAVSDGAVALPWRKIE